MKDKARRERIAQRVREALKQLAPCLAHSQRPQGDPAPCIHADSCKHYTPLKQVAGK